MLCSVKEKRNLDIGILGYWVIEILGYWDIITPFPDCQDNIPITQYLNISIKPGSGINEALVAIPQLSQPETE